MITKTTRSDYKKIIDNELKKIFTVNKKSQTPKILYDAMKYSLFNGGKRIRPILCLMAYDAIQSHKSKGKSQNYKEIIPFACGLELIHTFSLIQDDLPSMDNDDYRRCKPSLHKVYGEAAALLAADALFAMAFELFCKAKVNDSKKISAIRCLAQICGIRGLAGGQMMDILNQSQKLKVKSQKALDEQKTAKLIAGSMKIGAIVASASEKTIRNIENTGMYLGLLFQKTDDMLDQKQAVSTSQISGARKYAQKAIANLRALPGDFSNIIIMTDKILTRTK